MRLTYFSHRAICTRIPLPRFTTTFHALVMGTEARVLRVLVKCPTKGPYPCSFYLPFMDLVKTFISAEDTWLWLFLSGSSGVSAPTCSHPLAQHGKVKTIAFSAPLSLDNKWWKSQVIHQHFASLVCLKRHSAVFLYVPFTIYLLLLGVTETGSHSKLSKHSKLAWNSLSTPSWTQTCSDPSASASRVLWLQVCTNTPSLFCTLLI